MLIAEYLTIQEKLPKGISKN